MMFGFFGNGAASSTVGISSEDTPGHGDFSVGFVTRDHARSWILHQALRSQPREEGGEQHKRRDRAAQRCHGEQQALRTAPRIGASRSRIEMRVRVGQFEACRPPPMQCRQDARAAKGRDNSARKAR